MTHDEFLRLRELIERRCGIHLDERTRASLGASLGTRLDHLGLRGFDDYYDRLVTDSSDEEFRRLVTLVTNNETSFFRDPHQFRIFRTFLLPEVMAARRARRERKVRIWSAGCSTGEEAYSIAMVLRDLRLYARYSDWSFDVIGSDVNTEVLEAARRATYTNRAVRNVEGDWLQRDFERDGRRFRVIEEITRRVEFHHANLVAEPFVVPGGAVFDVIFCKNVTIYFRPEVTRRLIDRLFDTLTDGGYLLLGHSESLWQISDRFRLVEYDGAFCYRKGPAARGDVGRPVDIGAGVAARPSAPESPPPKSPPPSARPADRPIRRRGAADARPVETPEGGYEACLEAFRSRQWARAEGLLKALVLSRPAFVPAYLLLGGLYASRARYDEALALAQRALELDGLDAKAHLLVGMIEARRRDHEAAVQALRRALYLDDSLALGHFWLGVVYRDHGELDRAGREFASVVQNHRRHALILPEEFAVDLSVDQLVSVCRRSLAALSRPG